MIAVGLASPSSAVTTWALAASLALSGVPALVDALVQVRHSLTFNAEAVVVARTRYQPCLPCMFIQSRCLHSVARLQVMRLDVDAHVLMALAGVGSFALGHPLEGTLLFVLFHMAHALEAKFVRAAHTSLAGLMDAVPATAVVVDTDSNGAVLWEGQITRPVASVGIGSFVVVKPGEAVPLDGDVHEGQALVGALLCFYKIGRGALTQHSRFILTS